MYAPTLVQLCDLVDPLVLILHASTRKEIHLVIYPKFTTEDMVVERGRGEGRQGMEGIRGEGRQGREGI